MYLTRYPLLMELMAEHVSDIIQFGFMMSFAGASFVVCPMLSPICSDYDPTRGMDVEDGQFTT